MLERGRAFCQIYAFEVPMWSKFLLPKVPIWSPIHSKLGPHWVPILKKLGPHSIWEQCRRATWVHCFKLLKMPFLRFRKAVPL